MGLDHGQVGFGSRSGGSSRGQVGLNHGRVIGGRVRTKVKWFESGQMGSRGFGPRSGRGSRRSHG